MYKRKIARLVLTCFIRPPKNNEWACHFPDSDIHNNKISNLIWGTPKENSKHQIIQGTKRQGNSHHNSKLTEQQVKEIRKLSKTLSQKQLSIKYNTCFQNISLIINNKVWKHILLILICITIYNTAQSQVPRFQEYPNVIVQLKEWNEKYPNYTQLARYGYSDNNQPIYCLRVSNFNNNEAKKKVLVIATIHGNESLAASMCLGYIGYILYHKNDKEVKAVLDTRDIYFCPACSPDSYISHVRAVKGRDPNRDFNSSNPVAPVACIKVLFTEIKPAAALSIHTYMRGYLIPYGNKTELSPNHDDYQTIVGEMARLSNYKLIRACQLYGKPIHGTELDYFYNNGAFAVVAEVGTNQKKPKWSEIETEFYKTWPAFLYFVNHAPLIKIRSK